MKVFADINEAFEIIKKYEKQLDELEQLEATTANLQFWAERLAEDLTERNFDDAEISIKKVLFYTNFINGTNETMGVKLPTDLHSIEKDNPHADQ